MGSNNYKDELRKVRIAFMFSLLGSVLCLIVIFNSINSNSSTSRIITSALGFSFIVVTTTIVYIKLTKLLKHIKRRS